MIYLIDDKKDRQKVRYGIHDFKKYEHILKSIYELKEDASINFLSKADCILFHSSFDRTIEEEIETTFRNIPKVFFSNKYKITDFPSEDFIREMSSDVFYKNLDFFLKEYEQNRVINLKIIAFGEYYELAEAFEIKEKLSDNLFDKDFDELFQKDWLTKEDINLLNRIHELAYPIGNFELYYEKIMKRDLTLEQFLNEIDKLSQKIIIK